MSQRRKIGNVYAIPLPDGDMLMEGNIKNLCLEYQNLNQMKL